MGGTHPESERTGVVEVEFALEDTGYPFVGVSDDETCQVELQLILPGAEGYTEYFRVHGTKPSQAREQFATFESVDPTLLAAHDTAGLIELEVSAACPAKDLADAGAIPHEVRSENGQGTLTADIPTSTAPPPVIERFLDAHPAADLVRKQEKPIETPIVLQPDLKERLDARLTDRQQEVIRTAYEAGYYESPREMTGEELAAELGIAPTTFTEHIRSADQRVLTVLVEEHLL